MTFRLPTIYALLLFGTVFVQCSSTINPRPENDIRCIKVIFDLPMPLDETNVRQQKDSIFVFFYKDYVVYKMPYIYRLTIVNTDKAGNILGEKVIPKLKAKYFVYKTTENTGIRYDSVKAVSGKKMPVDSFLTNFGTTTFALPIDYQNRFSLVDRTIDAGRIVQSYRIKGVPDPSEYDSIYLYFSDNLKDIPFTLAKGTDLVDSKKLSKIRYLFSQKFDKEKMMTFPKREIGIEMEKTSMRGKHDEILEIFKKFHAIKE